VDDRDGVLSRLGGTFLCVLTLILVIGDGALMVTGTLPVPWGVGFLVLYLFGHTAFVQVLAAIAQTQNCISNTKTDLRLFHIQHDNDLRTHLGRLAEGINRVSELTTQGVKNDLIVELGRRSARGGPPSSIQDGAEAADAGRRRLPSSAETADADAGRRRLPSSAETADADAGRRKPDVRPANPPSSAGETRPKGKR
jgi:hypothetical protein